MSFFVFNKHDNLDSDFDFFVIVFTISIPTCKQQNWRVCHWWVSCHVLKFVSFFNLFVVLDWIDRKIYDFQDFSLECCTFYYVSTIFDLFYNSKDTVFKNLVVFLRVSEYHLIMYCNFDLYVRMNCCLISLIVICFNYDFHLIRCDDKFYHLMNFCFFLNCMVHIDVLMVHSEVFYFSYKQSLHLFYNWSNDEVSKHVFFCMIFNLHRNFFFLHLCKFSRDFSLQFFDSYCNYFSSVIDYHNTSEHLWNHNFTVVFFMVNTFFYSNDLHYFDHLNISVDEFTIWVTFFWVQVVHGFIDCIDYVKCCLDYVSTIVLLVVAQEWVSLVKHVTDVSDLHDFFTF